MDLHSFGILLGIFVAIAGALIGVGKILKTIRGHTEAIEGCRMEELVKKKDCGINRDDCIEKLDKLLQAMDRNHTVLKEDVKSDIKTIKNDIREDNQLWGEYREKSAGALGRIEGQLSVLIGRSSHGA